MTAPTAAPPSHDGRGTFLARGPSASTQAVARHRGRIAAGTALLAVSALLAALVYGNVGDRDAVLAAARRIDAGAVIEDGDLKVVRVASDRDVGTVPASRRAELVGRRAAFGVPAGALLAPGGVSDDPTVPVGSNVIGAVVKPGQYPIGLREGDTVLVLAAGDSASRGAVEALIVSVSTRSGPEGTAISLAVPAGDAAALARAGAEGRLLLTQPVR